MEDDDEFGDLYTDVLRPLEASVQPQPGGAAAPAQFHSRPIDLNANSDDEEILYGASNLKNSFPNSNSNSNSAAGSKLNASIEEKTLPGSVARSESGGRIDLNLEVSRVAGGDNSSFAGKVLEKGEGVKLSEKGSGGVDFMEEEDDLNIVVEERDTKDDDLVEKDTDLSGKKENLYSSTEGNENMVNFMDQSGVGEGGTEQMIPGLSGRLENQGGSNFEDQWDSDESEDDLQIVLNDNHGPMGMERMPGVDDEDDEDGEPLVIVADNGDAVHHHHHPQMMDEQEWGGEEAGAGADGEKKDLVDAAKASGGGSAPPASVQPKLGYSNHMYHHPFHSQFKYVRPGVAPLPVAAPVTPGGVQGQVRPPTTMGISAGRGRGDWRPAGIKGAAPMQKGFHPGYGTPAWGANSAGRGYGSGLDFTLPSHKTIFEVDIEGFEEKPWKLPGIDVSDFFNFGLNEESWKDYCKQLEQLRLETTMQSRIRVYESGRAEQDYDPDLPPELAAAVGAQDISTENANPGKIDAGPIASARGRLPVPTGRPIPVETGSGDRLPSIDTRRPRMHDSDAIIEIACHSSTDDPDVAEQPENEPDGEDLGGVDETVDPHQDDAEHVDRSSHVSNGQKRELVARRASEKKISSDDDTKRDDDFHFSSEVQYLTDGEIGVTREERSSKGRGHMKSPNVTTMDNDGEDNKVDDENELVNNSEDGKQSPPLSSSHAVGSDEEQAVAVGDDVKEESVMDDRSYDAEKDEMTLDAKASGAPEEGKLMHSTNKGKISSRVEQLSQENDDGEGVRSSENSKARSGSSKDHRKPHEHFDDEVLQVRHPAHAGSSKRPVAEEDNVSRKTRHERDETGRRNMAIKEREDSHSRRVGDPNSSLHRQMKSDSADRRRDSDISEGSWRRRDEDLHGRRPRVEDTRKREHANEIGSKNRVKDRESERGEKDDRHHIRNQRDDSNWRGANHDQDMVSRHRDRDDNLRTRSEKIDDVHHRRRKEVAPTSRDHVEKEDVTHNYREGSSRRKRERDDSSDQRKRDDHAKSKEDDVHYVRQKQEGSTQKERGERQRDHDEWNRPKQSHDESFSRRDREETRTTIRSARTAEDKTWSSHSRVKDDYKASGREYHQKDVGRHSDLKRRDRVENENVSQHRGHEDVHARGNQVSDDEKRARHGRPGTSDERAVRTSESSRLHEHRPKEGGRKSKESESGDRGSLVHAKRNEDEHSRQISETATARSRTERTERDSSKDDIHANRQSSKKRREQASSDDEQTGSKKGRSKLERWTSHKESDLGVDSKSSASLKKSKDQDAQNNTGSSLISVPREEPSRKVEDKKPRPSSDEKDSGAEMNNANAKVVDDKHLDTVAKLKKRSERFKLPMPSEKDAVSIKKLESEPLPSAPAENHQDSEIKSERPARKRRWTGN